MLPVIAIVGRPNVGKSTLFNTLAGRRISIVEPTAGVTRDRVSALVAWNERTFEILDTGGIGIVDEEDIRRHVEEQIAVALDLAAVVLFVVDVREGVTPLDLEVARRVRTLGKPVLLLANKTDVKALEPRALAFFELGLGDPLPISAIEGFERRDVLDRVVAALPPAPPDGERAPEPALKVAIVGKRNAGKSTLVNALAREERMIVSEIPGTTRDAVDVVFERDGETFVAIDTAGLRKKGREEHAIEVFSRVRAEESIGRCDVACLVLDVTSEISIVDKHLARAIENDGKPCVIVANKWDLARERIVTGEFDEYVRQKLPGLAHAPLVVTSALERKGVASVLKVARDLHRQAQTRITTGDLNRTITEAVKVVRPPVRRGVQPKIYYATQTSVQPPTIVVFCNKPALIPDQFRRYLVNRLRERFDLAEVPVRMVFRERQTIYVDREKEERRERKRRKTGKGGPKGRARREEPSA